MLRSCANKARESDVICTFELQECCTVFGHCSAKTLELANVNYVDDSLFPCVGSNASNLVIKMRCLCPLVLDTFASYLLMCLLAPDKSTILLALKSKDPVGVGLTKVDAREFVLSIVSIAYGCVGVPVSSVYKHVGKTVQLQLCDTQV